MNMHQGRANHLKNIYTLIKRKINKINKVKPINERATPKTKYDEF